MMRYLTLCCCLALTACGGSVTGPDDSGPPLVRYAVAYTYQYPGAFGGTFEGEGTAEFAITFSTADSVAGHSFGTTGEIHQPLGLGFWNVDAYAVWVVTQYQGFPGPTLRLRLSRQGTVCSGRLGLLNGSNYALKTCTVSLT